MAVLPALLLNQTAAFCWCFLWDCQLLFDNDAKEEDTCRHTKRKCKHRNDEKPNGFAVDCGEDDQSAAKDDEIGGKGKEVAKVVQAISALSIGGQRRNETHMADLHERPSYAKDDSKAHVIDELALVCRFHHHKERHKGNRHQ